MKIFERIKEPSTWAGLSGILLAFGTLFKDDNLPVIADAVQSSGETYIASGNVTTAIGVFVMGILAVFMPERKK